MKSLNAKLLLVIAALIATAEAMASTTLKSVQIVSENGKAVAYDQDLNLLATADQHFLYDLYVGDNSITFAKQGGWFGTDVASIGKIVNQGGGTISYVLKDYNKDLKDSLKGTIPAGQTATMPADTHVPWKTSGFLNITIGPKPITFTINQ